MHVYFIRACEEPVKRQKITVVIDLQYEVSRSDFTTRVLEGGIVLELAVTWPIPMVDLEAFHRKWVLLSDSQSSPTFTMHQPEVLALENALKRKYDRADDNASSTARINFTFPVQTQIESKTNLLFNISGTKRVFVELKELTETYAVVKDKDEFEEF